MRRDLDSRLTEWRLSEGRKPLLLRGARQVGKTWALRAFAAREYERSLYLNFEEDPGLAGLFAGRLSPEVVLRNLELYTGTRVEAGTLLILDEVQACAEALNSLKYFAEHAPEVHVCAAGSLLRVRLGRMKSFPVGKVQMLDLGPMTFLEWLDARGEGGLRELIEGLEVFGSVPEPVHDRLIGLLGEYYFVGGMPEAVELYSRTRDVDGVRRVQRDILRGYELDFAKYASPTDIPKLSLVWGSVPAHLARENKKFMFSTVRKGARAREYENAIAWLADAGLIRRAFSVRVVRLPLAGYARRDIFKVYPLDVGLLCAMVKLPASVLVEGNRLFVEFRGSLVESYVAQQLVAAGEEDLFYWTSPGGRAELDFVVERDAQVFPLEVKAGLNLKSKSLRSFDDQFGPPVLSRANLLNLKADGRTRNYPLYAVSRFPGLDSQSQA